MGPQTLLGLMYTYGRPCVILWNGRSGDLDYGHSPCHGYADMVDIYGKLAAQP